MFQKNLYQDDDVISPLVMDSRTQNKQIKETQAIKLKIIKNYKKKLTSG